MSDHETVAERRDVFHGQASLAKPPNSDDFTLRVADPALRFGLRMDATAAVAAAQPAGFDLSQPINSLRQSAVDGGANGVKRRLSARLGPDEWLLIADTGSDTAEALMARIAAEMGEAAHTLVDVSHRNLAIELTGSAAADVLNTGCPLDLGDQAFPVGTATRTLFAKAEIILCRCPDIEREDIEREDREQQPLYRVECWRSFGRYMHAYLQESAELIGARV
jgi:sarcosine oxidase subunit gamma